MIPKVIQDGPNIMPRYFCSVCGAALKKTDPITGEPSGWKFCQICGNPIEWEKAGPPILMQYTVLITFEDGSTITRTVVGTRHTVEYEFPIDQIFRHDVGRQKRIITNTEIVSVREFTREDKVLVPDPFQNHVENKGDW